jgi:hypothetical protein
MIGALLVLLGCGSSGSTPQDRGLDPGQGTGGTGGAGNEANPYGKTYPTANIGYQARAGQRPGNIIRNYKFLGYVDGDSSKGLTTVSLADFYDPEMRQYKIVHFTAGALWCPPCNQEADVIVPLIPGLKEKKVGYIQAIIEGDVRGTGSVQSDLDIWKDRHKINYTFFLDPEQQNLGQFFDAAAIPWNANLDARSMEILSSEVGFSPDSTNDFDTWLKWVDEHPAQPVQ